MNEKDAHLSWSLSHPEVAQPGAEVGNRSDEVVGVLAVREGLMEVPAEVGQELADPRDVHKFGIGCERQIL